jgi:type II secretory pathway pseudopilin PulG
MSKRGTTLIESVIAIFIVSVVLVTFMQSLNAAMTGTLQLNRKTSALNLAKSQIEYTKNSGYNVSTGDLSNVYSLITTGSNISDKINYNISGQVTNVSGTQALQQITVNVSYLQGKQVQLTAYKTSDGSLTEPASRGLLVTDNIKNVPILPAGSTETASCGEFKGYYHVFTTGPTPSGAPASVSTTWKFYWKRVGADISSLGAPMIAIYPGVPVWADRDYMGVVREDGIVYRGQNNLGASWLAVGLGDLPGVGDSHHCHCWDESNCCPDETTETVANPNPIIYVPHMCTGWVYAVACWLMGYTGNYPCCGACYGGDGFAGTSFWEYDNSCGFFGLGPCTVKNGYIERTIAYTTSLPAGTYTILFFNAENKIDLETVSASVTYWK